MIKVHISPDFIGSNETGGIRRVVEAMLKYFPEYDIEHVRQPKKAHIIINHGAMPTWARDIPSINVNHGLYWSRQPWELGYQEVNQKVIDSMCMSVAHTAPSEWVSHAIRRGGLFYPEVVYHGVDADEFEPKENQGYVLWNKARADYVSDPNDMMQVAAMLPDVPFQSTIGNKRNNVSILGPTTYTQMKDIVARAGVYLCTARETFGIGTLEALAAGVPVAGWDWGGQSEIILQGETGYLAPPGDFDALAECIKLCLEHRDKLSKNAYQDARKRWTWQPRIKQYADIVKRVYKDYYQTKRPKVSVIITTYNLDHYLPDCLNSVVQQNFKDFECLVIDDALQDSTKLLVQNWSKNDDRIKYVRPPHNLKLTGARNFGLSKSSGHYIRHLDADDFLAKNALALEVEALDSDPHTHIVYGHLESVNEDGSRIMNRGEVVRSGWPDNEFNWFRQMAHLNQLPSCSMARREVYERTGGYRDRMTRNEDAEFWCRATSLGFRARKFTQAVTYFHRHREDSKGAIEWQKEGKEPDWTGWFPWRLGAGDYQEAQRILKTTGYRHPSPHLVPFAAQGKPHKRKAWYVHDYAYPVVSVIVTCGPHHERHLLDSLDSIQAQSYPDWECVVVNDTGKPWKKDIMGAPYARVVNMDGNQGTSAARNEGFKHVSGRYIVWMDADDFWLPWFLERMVAYAEQNDGIIYSDMIQDDGEKLETYRYPEFECERLANSMHYPGSSVLYPRKIAQSIFDLQGGYDLSIPGMEDYDFQIATHSQGFCAYRIPEALFIYRLYSSTKRETDYAKIEDIRLYLNEKWREYRLEGKEMGCGCGSKKLINTKPSSTMSSSGNFPEASRAISEEYVATEMVNVQYVGPNVQNFTVRSKVQPGMSYRFGNNPANSIKTVLLMDAEHLTSQIGRQGEPQFRIVSGASFEQRDPSALLGQVAS